MKKLKLIISLLVLVFFSGCSSEDDSTPEENTRNGILTFGWFGDSGCSGSCSDIYKIENGKVYKDIDHNYPENTFLEGNFQLLTSANITEYQVLIDALPDELFNEPNGYLNCNDCTNEFGGFYLEFKDEDGFHRSWRFRNAVYPAYMESYRSLLLNKISNLNSL